MSFGMDGAGNDKDSLPLHPLNTRRVQVIDPDESRFGEQGTVLTSEHKGSQRSGYVTYYYVAFADGGQYWYSYYQVTAIPA